MQEKLLPFLFVLATFLPLFILALYKIYQWHKKEELQNVWQEIKAAKRKKQQLKFAQPLYKFRTALFCFLSVLVVLSLVLFVTLPYDSGYKDLVGIFLLVSILGSICTNNLLVHKYWRCPFCRARLPIRIGRSGARPKTVYTCPHCQKNFLEK